MNKKKRFLWIIPVVQLALTIGGIIALPEQVPIHFNIYGEVDRLGKKYELLIMVVIPLLLSILLQGEIYKIKRHTCQAGGEIFLQKTNILYGIGIVVNTVFLLVTCRLLYAAFYLYILDEIR